MLGKSNSQPENRVLGVSVDMLGKLKKPGKILVNASIREATSAQTALGIRTDPPPFQYGFPSIQSYFVVMSGTFGYTT